MFKYRGCSFWSVMNKEFIKKQTKRLVQTYIISSIYKYNV